MKTKHSDTVSAVLLLKVEQQCNSNFNMQKFWLGNTPFSLHYMQFSMHNQSTDQVPR